MKILDPSSATFTLAEVHTFLRDKPAPTPTPKRGAYEPIDLHGYHIIKRDFELYLSRSAPHVPLLPPPETFIAKLLARFREKNIVLTKGEVLTLIDLGVGINRPAEKQTQRVDNDKDNGMQSVEGDDAAAIKNEEGITDPVKSETNDDDDYTLLTAVVEEAENRFTDDQLTEILTILRESMPLKKPKSQDLIGRQNGVRTTENMSSRDGLVPTAALRTEHGGRDEHQQMNLDASMVEDEGAEEDDALLNEPGYQRDMGEGDIDGDD